MPLSLLVQSYQTPTGMTPLASKAAKLTGIDGWEPVTGSKIVEYFGEHKIAEALRLPPRVRASELGKKSYLALDINTGVRVPIDIASAYVSELNTLLAAAIKKNPAEVPLVFSQNIGPICEAIFLDTAALNTVSFSLNNEQKKHLETITVFLKKALATPLTETDSKIRYWGSTPWDTVHGWNDLAERLSRNICDDRAYVTEALLRGFGLRADELVLNDSRHHMMTTLGHEHNLRSEIPPLTHRVLTPQKLAEALGANVVRTAAWAVDVGFPQEIVQFSLPTGGISPLELAIRSRAVDCVGTLLELGAHPGSVLHLPEAHPYIARMLKDAWDARETGKEYTPNEPLGILLSQPGVQVIKDQIKDKTTFTISSRDGLLLDKIAKTIKGRAPTANVASNGRIIIVDLERLDLERLDLIALCLSDRVQRGFKPPTTYRYTGQPVATAA